MKLMINDFMEQKLWLGRTHFFHFGKEKSWGAVKNQPVYVKEDDYRKALRLVELVNGFWLVFMVFGGFHGFSRWFVKRERPGWLSS